MAIDPNKKAQIKAQSKAQVRALLFNKTLMTVSAYYSNYSNVFSVENAAKLPKYIEINDHVIELKKGKQPFFRRIYSLEPVKLEILKMYIEIKLANNFI